MRPRIEFIRKTPTDLNDIGLLRAAAERVLREDLVRVHHALHALRARVRTVDSGRRLQDPRSRSVRATKGQESKATYAMLELMELLVGRSRD